MVINQLQWQIFFLHTLHPYSYYGYCLSNCIALVMEAGLVHVARSMCQFYEFKDKVYGSIKIFTPLKNTNQKTTDFLIPANYIQL